MATIIPFQPLRYTAKAGDPATLLTQPYDKISPEMRARYLAANPYNLVRIILGEAQADDNDSNNIYTRGAAYLNQWIKEGILAKDPAPGFYAYFQEFEVPDTGEKAVRQGFIGLGKVEDYSAGIVYRHEQTLSGPKKDRLQVLRHTHAHFGQIFMLYPDREGAVDAVLSKASQGAPVLDVVDEYGARHRVWAISDPTTTAQLQSLMADKKLLIADGHHRYETSLNYRNENPNDPAAAYVMMTFVNMYSPGLRILATHRVLRNLEHFDAADLLRKVEQASNPASSGKSCRIRVVTAQGEAVYTRPVADGELDVPILHQELLGGLLGINEEAVRNEKHIKYVRGAEAAIAEVKQKGAQVAFLLDPTPMDDMARIAFGGGVMPQKSTDFYPKLLTGATIYKLD